MYRGAGNMTFYRMRLSERGLFWVESRLLGALLAGILWCLRATNKVEQSPDSLRGFLILSSLLSTFACSTNGMGALAARIRRL